MALINSSITLDEEFSKHWDQIGFPFPLKVLPIFKVPHIHILRNLQVTSSWERSSFKSMSVVSQELFGQ
jgi:hypothetical protein